MEEKLSEYINRKPNEEEFHSYLFALIDEKGFSLAHNEIARKVKIADLLHNLDTSRLNGESLPKHPEMKECLDALLSIENREAKHP